MIKYYAQLVCNHCQKIGQAEMTAIQVQDEIVPEGWLEGRLACGLPNECTVFCSEQCAAAALEAYLPTAIKEHAEYVRSRWVRRIVKPK